MLEIQIELAWLADPVTFPYYMEARVQGDTVHVRGYVPARAVREQALKHARNLCSLKIADGLKEHSGAAVKTARASASQLQQSAATALRQSLGSAAGKLQVKCGADSKITVSGWVASFEEKLTVSQALRRLHGCTAVVNNLHVEASGASAATSVPARLASQQRPAGVPVVDAPTTSQTGPASSQGVPARPASMSKSAQPASVTPSVGGNAGAQTAVNQSATHAKPPRQAAQGAPVLPFGFLQKFKADAGKKKAPDAVSSNAPKQMTPSRPAPVPVRSVDPATISTGAHSEDVPAASGPPGSVKVLKEWLVPVGETTTEELRMINTGKPANAEPPSKSGTRPTQSSAHTPAAGDAGAWWNARIEPEAAAAEQTTIQPVKAAAKDPKSSTQVVRYRRGEPYVTRGIAILEEPTTAAKAPAHLLLLVKTACGSAASDVRLHLLSANHVRVHLRPRSTADSHVLAQRVMGLPALAGYEVEVHIEVPD
jgi:hypothetical protein